MTVCSLNDSVLWKSFKYSLDGYTQDESRTAFLTLFPVLSSSCTIKHVWIEHDTWAVYFIFASLTFCVVPVLDRTRSWIAPRNMCTESAVMQRLFQMQNESFPHFLSITVIKEQLWNVLFLTCWLFSLREKHSDVDVKNNVHCGPEVHKLTSLLLMIFRAGRRSSRRCFAGSCL